MSPPENADLNGVYHTPALGSEGADAHIHEPTHVLSQEDEHEDEDMTGPDGLVKVEYCIPACFPESADGRHLQCVFCEYVFSNSIPVHGSSTPP